MPIIPPTVPMSVPIIVGILTAIIGPLIMYYIRRWHEEKDRLKRREDDPVSNEDRIFRLEGKWKCSFAQKVSGYDNSIEASLNLKMKDGLFVGEAEYTYNSPDRTFLCLYDGVFDGRILKINYKNKEKHVFQYGSIVMIMDNEGNKLNGMFVGYSPSLSLIVHGEINLYQKIGV